MTALVAAAPLGPVCAAVTICAPVQALGGAVGEAGGAVARTATTGAAFAVFHALLGALTSAATQAIADMTSALFRRADAVPFGAPWFQHQLGLMASVAALVVFPLLAAATIGSVLRQDTGRLMRTWLVWLPLAALLTVVMLPLLSGAMAASDAMTSIVTGGFDGDAKSAILHLMPPATALGGGVLAALISAVMLLGALAIWLELVVRSAAIVVTAFFLPLILAGLVWPATAHMVRRVLEVLVALILSKFVVAAVLSLGVAAVGGGSAPGGGQPDMLGGAAILLLAAFAPMTLLRLVPILEAAAIGHLEGRSRQPIRGAADIAGRAHRQFPLAARMFGTSPGGSGGSGGAEAAAGAPAPILQMAGWADPAGGHPTPAPPEASHGAAAPGAGARSGAGAGATDGTAPSTPGMRPSASGTAPGSGTDASERSAATHIAASRSEARWPEAAGVDPERTEGAPEARR